MAVLLAEQREVLTAALPDWTDIIHLIETSLNEHEENPLTLCGYEVVNCSARKGMGISTYFNKSKFKNDIAHVKSEFK